MPIPIAIPAAAATFVLSVQSLVDQLADGVAYVTGEREPTLDELQSFMHSYEKHLARWAVGAVFERMGLEFDTEEGVTAETVTKAINAGPLAGSGVELSNLFDRRAVIEDLTRWGVGKACEAFGIGEGGTVEELRAAVRLSLSDDIAAQLASESGELIEAAPDAARIVGIIAAVPPDSGWNTPRDFSPEGINNRERQARFRAVNRKHWEPR